GEQIDLEAQQRDDAEQQQRHRQHQDRYAPTDRKLDDVHEASSPVESGRGPFDRRAAKGVAFAALTRLGAALRHRGTRRLVDEPDRAAGLQAVLADDDDALVAAQPFDHFDQAGVRQPGLYAALFGLVAVRDEHGRRTLGFDDRAARDSQRRAAAFEHDADAREHPGLEVALRIEHFDGRLERARGGIERRADALDPAAEVGAGEGVDDDRDGLLGAQLRELALRHVDFGDQRIEISDLESPVVDVDGVADLDVAGRDHAGDRRANLRVADIELRKIARGLEPLHFGAGVVDGLGSHELAIEQLQRPLVLAIELAEVHFGLLQFEAQAIAIQARQHLPGLHAIAFLDQDLADFAADLGDDGRFL